MAYRIVSGIVLSSLFASCGMFHHSKAPAKLPGTWQATPVTIDGDSKDWPSPYPSYDSKAMLAYATSNDRTTLYITVETGDAMTQVKILNQGLTVAIDTSGRKDAAMSINFPLANTEDEIEVPQSGHSSRGLEQKIAKHAQQANQLSIDGFGATCSGGFMVNQSTPCGIKVRMRVDEYKQLVWEAAIPFKAIYHKDEITAADAGKPISVGFIVHAGADPNAKDKSGATAPMSTDPSSATIGRNTQGGRMQGSVGSAPVNPMYETTKTWKQFGLAWQ